MRVAMLGGSKVSVATLSSELPTVSGPELAKAFDDLAFVEFAAIEGEPACISLGSEGQRQATMLLESIALSEPQLVAKATTAASFLAWFVRPHPASSWQRMRLQWKWFLRDIFRS